ncbi:hypothetical protein XELAEV_18030234mg [Xenopus laevis]|uniref:Uncharacterized protein n=1 Tax=Xenopus laevis TaxID=8355 RepID=A0A974CV73_XENLA|nr:hypothetical protein XELAEV_18030234mg [Xenopus laevis]
MPCPQQHIYIIFLYLYHIGASWILYEEHFRQRLAVQEHLMWGNKDVDLWLAHDPGLFCSDNVHLTDISLDIFNMGLQEAMEKTMEIWGEAKT